MGHRGGEPLSYRELGSGEIETSHDRVMVHFGSPTGTKYKVRHVWDRK